ncbi:MAG: Rieske (2Fe-2S) protein [Rhodanobacter sp.]|nr:MAG: Rieske (2Fe-2S) protein [Rhodanobacter sp.]
MVTVTRSQRLCPLQEIPDGGATAVDARLCGADGVDELVSVILLRRGGQVWGYLNVCPHAGRRLDYAPGKFLLQQDTLICAVHGASFEQASGACVGGPCRGESLHRVRIRVEDGTVDLLPED